MFDGKVRADRRCGSSFLLPDGSESECDGSNENPCFSKWDYCGPGKNTAPVLPLRTTGRRRTRTRTGRGPGGRIGDAELIIRSLMDPDPENVILKVRIIVVVNGGSVEGTENTVTAQNMWIINQNKGKMFL